MWTQRNPRFYKLELPFLGYCSLVCPDGSGEDQNKWRLCWQEEIVPVGVWGDDIAVVKEKVLIFVSERLVSVVFAIKAMQ